MKALIFDSGVGKRMGDFTEHNHKSMARLANGETIFHRQLRLLWANGITEVIVTTGPFAKDLEVEYTNANLLDLNVTFVANPQYQTTNYIYSFYLASDQIDEDVLVLHGDLAFSDSALKAILEDERENLVAVDPTQKQPEKDFKARLERDIVTEISVTIFDENCFALQPLYKLSQQTFAIWANEVAAFIENGDDQVYAENALNKVSDKLRIAPFYYSNYFIQEVDTLEDLAVVSENIRLFDFAEQIIIDGTDGYRKIPDILKKHCSKRPLLVCGSSFDSQFLKGYLDTLNTDFVLFRGYSANPKYEEIVEGVRQFRQNACDFIISIGGGSALDTAKIIKLYAALDAKQPYLEQDYLYSDIPHLAIPTTAGTGSESTRFAVMYKDGQKLSVAHDSIIPDYVILEPKLLSKLPIYQKKATLLDALCQCIESIWSVKTTTTSQKFAVEGATLILDNYQEYLKDDLGAATAILKAANLSGKAINLTETTAAHAMSYKLTSLHDISHGHAVALCLPEVWNHVIESVGRENVQVSAQQLNDSLALLNDLFSTSEPKEAVADFRLIFDILGLVRPVLKDEKDLDILSGSVNQQRLANNPVAMNREVIRKAYDNIFAKTDEIQGIELSILLDIDALCTKHGIQYYLAEGTLLGAIRHKGFIPWDDDIDIYMKRTDYNRFLEIAPSELPSRLEVQHSSLIENYWSPIMKIRLIEDCKDYGQAHIAHLTTHNGPCIDIFPLEYSDHGVGFRNKVKKIKIQIFRATLTQKLKMKPVQGFKEVTIRLFSKFFTVSMLHKLIDELTRGEEQRTGRYITSFSTYHHIKHQIVPATVFESATLRSFESYDFPVPTGYDELLTTIYGNYMEMPPLEQRSGKHHYNAQPDEPYEFTD